MNRFFPLLLALLGWIPSARGQITEKPPELSPLAKAFESACKANADLETYELVRGKAIAFPRMEAVLEWERGSGHGGSLEFYRAEWHAEELHVTRLALEPDRRRYATPYPLDEPEATLVTTKLPAPDALEALELVRRAIGLRLKERELDPLKGRRYSSSSADFHSRLTVSVGNVTLFDESYTGYPSNRSQPEYLSLRVAERVLWELLRDSEWKPATDSETARKRLLTRISDFAKDGWWVKDRLLQILGVVGDERFLPFLQARIEDELPTNSIGATRTLYYALNAYARLSKLDLRPDKPETMDVREVRAAYLEEFARVREH